MRRPWIKIETATPDKPEICAIATRLRIDTDSVVGKLVRLWSWAEVNRVEANDIGVTKEFIDKLVGRKGFAEALEAAGWLVVANESLQFANFERHNGNASKIRGQTAKRVERHRQRKPGIGTSLPAKDTVVVDAKIPSEGANANSVLNVENDDSPLNKNHSTVEFDDCLATPEATVLVSKGDVFNVTNFEVSTEYSETDTTTEAFSDETESPGKLPRLSKRSARLPADEDQPLLF
jgi:hypothetical protein